MIVLSLEKNSCDYLEVPGEYNMPHTESGWVTANIFLKYSQCFPSFHYYAGYYIFYLSSLLMAIKLHLTYN
jgi:hypothetical protein